MFNRPINDMWVTDDSSFIPTKTIKNTFVNGNKTNKIKYKYEMWKLEMLHW